MYPILFLVTTFFFNHIMSGTFKASIIAIVVVVIIIVLLLVLFKDDHTCHRCHRCRKSRCRTNVCKESKCRCKNKESWAEPEPETKFYKRIEKTAEDMTKSGNFPTSAQDWGMYLATQFVEPEVHESHEKYMTEAINRTTNPSKWTITDGNTSYNTRFVGLSRPRRVKISDDSQLQFDVPEEDYRDPTPRESAEGQLEYQYGYEN
jgi:uncharacterized membrane protein